MQRDEFDVDGLEELDDLEESPIAIPNVQPPDGKEAVHAAMGDLVKQVFDKIPVDFIVLFDLDPERLKLLTRTPRRAMASTVWLSVVNAAKNPTVDLIEFLITEVDKRMIALDGQGRTEAVDILLAKRLSELDEEGEEVRAPDDWK